MNDEWWMIDHTRNQKNMLLLRSVFLCFQGWKKIFRYELKFQIINYFFERNWYDKGQIISEQNCGVWNILKSHQIILSIRMTYKPSETMLGFFWFFFFVCFSFCSLFCLSIIFISKIFLHVLRCVFKLCRRWQKKTYLSTIFQILFWSNYQNYMWQIWPGRLPVSSTFSIDDLFRSPLAWPMDGGSLVL